MIFEEFILDITHMKNINWYKYFPDKDFIVFEEHIKNSIDKWHTLKTEIEQYKDFWAWYRNIKIQDDFDVVGTAKDISNDIPELFVHYISLKMNDYSEKVDSWINNNEDIKECIELYRKYKFDFNKITNYVNKQLNDKFIL